MPAVHGKNANDAGKTATVRILATLTRVDAGQARVAGFGVRRDRSAVCRRISLAGQFAMLDEAQTGEEPADDGQAVAAVPEGGQPVQSGAVVPQRRRHRSSRGSRTPDLGPLGRRPWTLASAP